MKTTLLAITENNYQANILQAALSNEGIESFVKNEVISSVLPVGGFQIEIHVPEEDYERGDMPGCMQYNMPCRSCLIIKELSALTQLINYAI